MDTAAAPKSQPHKYLIGVIVVLLFIIVAGIAALVVMNKDKKTDTNGNNQNNNIPTFPTDNTTTQPETETAAGPIRWQFNDTAWTPAGTPPECPDPIEFNAPVDVNKASHTLYPGQTRGTHYKAHGGFRFDTASSGAIEVKLPLEAALISGSRYIEGGEIQYILDFIMPCGIMFRYDHLYTLTPEFAQLVDKHLPAAKVDDSRGYAFPELKLYPAGTLLATEIGHRNPKNIGFDFGVYDLREQNEISRANSTWAAAHANEKSQTFYAICWLNHLTSPAKEQALSLPGPGTEGKTSDYCN